MRRFLNFAILIGVCLALLPASGGCKKGNTMGKLKGMWQVMSVEEPDPENPEETIIREWAKDKRYYYSFNLDMIQLTDETGDFAHPMASQYYVGTVDGESPDYTLTFPYENTPDKIADLRPWGVDETPVRMHIVTIDSKQMVARVGANTVILRKF